ncbi:MAG: response regulator, partial [bacterium]|nr:response regulator [bacterium]
MADTLFGGNIMTDGHTDKPVLFIVEDAPETLDMLVEELQHAGFEVLIARSGESALRQVDFAQSDLILLDVVLPGMNGFETCRRLKQKEKTQDIPVIFMTALTDTLDKVKGFDAGGIDYLTKPLQAAEVIARVKTHLTVQKLQQTLQAQNIRLEEQTLRFQTLADAAFEGIVIHEEGSIIEINRSVEEMFGYQRSELIGKNVLDFVAPASRKIVQQHIETEDEHPLDPGKVEGYEAEAVRKNGDRFPIEVHVKTMLSQGRRRRIAAVRDLSRQKALEQEKAQLKQENLNLKTTGRDRYKFGEILGKSPAMQEIYEFIAQAAASDASVMICGESGTGKELVARTIHQRSERRERECVAVNCGAIPENLFENEFFGHRKGAFTGADRNKPGYFDLAHQGTLFLDEVGELSPILQVKLLRAIEQGEYHPVGSHTAKTVDVRIIAATNRNVEEMLHEGAMREDFFFRLNVISIAIPPLRERREDIPLLIEHVWEQCHKDIEFSTLPGHILHQLYHHDWPGNIRELQNVLQRYLTVNRLEFPGSRRPEPSSPHENGA